MNILVCVKRVPATGGRIVLTADEQAIDTRFLGFTVSPHEECAVEEAVRIVEANGGSSTVLTLGPEPAAEQLRDAMAIGIDRAILLETDGRRLGSGRDRRRDRRRDRGRTRGRRRTFDLILFGNEAADSGDFQVGDPGRRGARPAIRQRGQGARDPRRAGRLRGARRPRGWEVFELPLPAVVAVREGINLPRYPSVPGRLRAKKKEIVRIVPTPQGGRPDEGPPAAPVRAGEPGRDPRHRRRGCARRRRAARPDGARRPMILTSSSTTPDDPSGRRSKR